MLANLLGKSEEYKDFQAVYHTGTVVYGKEYYFGGSMDQRITGGIDCDTPSHTQYGTPIKTLDFGQTEKSLEEIQQFVEQQNQSNFMAKTYEAMEHNCNTFTNEFINFLNGSKLPSEILDQGRRFKQTSLGQLYSQIMGGNGQSNNLLNNFINQEKSQESQVKQQQPIHSTPIEKEDAQYKALYIQQPKVFIQNVDELQQLIKNNEHINSVLEAYNQNYDTLISQEQLRNYLQEAKLSTLQKYEIYSLLCTTSCWQLIQEEESPIYLIVHQDSGINSKEFMFYLTNYLSQICGMKEGRQNYQAVYQYIQKQQQNQENYQQILRVYYNFSRILTTQNILSLNVFDDLLKQINQLTQVVLDQSSSKQQLACLNLCCAIYGRLLITLAKQQPVTSQKAQINSSLLSKLKDSKAPAVQQLLKYCKLSQKDEVQNLDEFY